MIPQLKAEISITGWLFRLLAAAGIMGITLTFYLSWVPDSRMNAVFWMPRWVGEWADSGHKDFRTALPFVGLGLMTGTLLILRRMWKPAEWLAAWAALVAVVLLAELGQLPIVTRRFTFADIGWGTLGAATSLGLLRFLAWAMGRVRRSGAPVSGRRIEFDHLSI